MAYLREVVKRRATPPALPAEVWIHPPAREVAAQRARELATVHGARRPDVSVLLTGSSRLLDMRSAGALLMLMIALAACGDERAAQTREPTKPARRTRLHANALAAQTASLATRLPAPREITFQGTSLADWAERLDEYDVEGAADARRRLEGLSEDDLRATLSLAFQSVLGIDSNADTCSAEIVVRALVQRLVPDLVALSTYCARLNSSV